MRSTDGVKFANISATTAAFVLTGGKYAAAIIGSNFGTAKVQILMPDGSTYLSVASGTDFSANGFATVDLPPGTYKLTIASATAVYFSLTRVPSE